MGIRKYKPTSPGRRFVTGSDFEEVTKTTPEQSLLRQIIEDGRAQQQRPRHQPPHRRRAQAPLPDHRLQAPQGRRPRARSRRSSTTPTGRRASPCSTTPTARSATSWRRYRLRVGDTVMSGPTADIKPGNCLALRDIPTGTIVHNIELQIGRGGQLVPLRRRRRPADGQGGRLRHPAPALHARCAWSTSTAAPRWARSATSRTRTSRRQGRAAAAGRASARRSAAPP